MGESKCANLEAVYTQIPPGVLLGKTRKTWLRVCPSDERRGTAAELGRRSGSCSNSFPPQLTRCGGPYYPHYIELRGIWRRCEYLGVLNSTLGLRGSHKTQEDRVLMIQTDI